MAKTTYSKKLQDPRWQKKRLEIMERDSFSCKLCGDTQSMLNVHHIRYTAKDVWNEPEQNLITICKHCHYIIHNVKNSFLGIVGFFKGDTKIFRKGIFQLDEYNILYLVIISQDSEITILKYYDFEDKTSVFDLGSYYSCEFDLFINAINKSLSH